MSRRSRSNKPSVRAIAGTVGGGLVAVGTIAGIRYKTLPDAEAVETPRNCSTEETTNNPEADIATVGAWIYAIADQLVPGIQVVVS